MFSNIKEKILQGMLHNKYENSKYLKSNFKQISVKGNFLYQFSFYTKTQVFHENVNEEELFTKLEELMNNHFRQAQLLSQKYSYEYKISKKGKILSNKNANKIKIDENVDHNNKKKYLLEEGQVILPLVDLGVMNEQGYVVKKYYDKYKQINKFLEIIDDTIKDEANLNIIDFGCGKSYLTFILYYYLTFVKKIKCYITGLDLKEDVIKECNNIKQKYNYENLEFICMDVANYQPKKQVDMILSLHACNTATDHALFHAINLRSKYIFCAPCCHKEINNQLKKEKLNIINQYGLLKDRFSTLLTDAIRANALKYFGYKVNVAEFVSLEHSAKNVLIKAVLTDSLKEDVKEEIENILSDFEINQTLITMLKEAKMIK